MREIWKLYQIEKQFLYDIIGEYGEWLKEHPGDYSGQFSEIQGDRIADKESKIHRFKYWYHITDHTLSVFDKRNALVPRKDLVEGFREAIRKQTIFGQDYIFYLFFN